MKVGYLYELEFPYEDGQGSSRRPVLIIVVNDDYGKVIGLKVTRSSSDKYKHRIPINNSPNSNLSSQSYVQYDRYELFENIDKKSRGVLSEEDFTSVVKAFKEYHGV